MRGCKSFVIIGAGNVAWHLSQALKAAGLKPLGVFSRTLDKARSLATLIGSPAATNDFNSLSTVADVYFIAVKDDAIGEVVSHVCPLNPQALFVHTAGSVSIDIFRGHAVNYGVFYPMQSFSRNRVLDFRKIPIFVEGNSAESAAVIEEIATSISDVPVVRLNSEQRRMMHLAAVFASNFTNHCYASAAKVMQRAGVPFDALLPLIDETAAKVHDMNPVDAQTGPAVRFDVGVMRRQEELLSGDELAIYRAMSAGIHSDAEAAGKSPKPSDDANAEE